MTAAMSEPTKPEPTLGYHEDDPVWGALLRVKGLGDGLSKLAEVAPVAMKRGQRGVLLVEFGVGHLAYPASTKTPTGGAQGVDRLHNLLAGNVVIVDRSLVAKILDEHQRQLDELANRKALFDSSGKVTEEAKPGEGEGDGDEPLSEAEAKVASMFGNDGKGRRGRKAQ